MASYGASGDLRRQVEAGAPIDLVVLASADPVAALVRTGQADPATRAVVATNQLVLIGPVDAQAVSFATLDRLPARALIAIGDPGAVPAGQYARDALQRLGKWDALAGRIVLGGDVAQVLAYARRGEVAAAIVYRTEIRGLHDIKLLDSASGDWAPHPEVVSAVCRHGQNPKRAAEFLRFLGTADARELWREFGFGAP
jgi:molybdate transport system substrate-binding protein